MCLPALLDKLSGSQGILRSHMSTTPVDLARFRVKDPVEWLVDDVVSWMLDVAKRHGIPFEEMNMHRFANLTGQQMIGMTEQNFIERDPIWGPLIYNEFRKNLAEDTSVIDEIMKKYSADEDAVTAANGTPSTSFEIPKTHIAPNPSPMVPQFHTLTQTLNHTLNQTLNQSIQLNTNLAQNLQQTLNQSLATSLAAGLSTVPKRRCYGSPKSSILGSEDCSNIADSKVKKNKDGKPRKRSQHTKGNKLWEFIRDALKDPLTCPSVVRWEDPIEGVFRIVESEKLARLWGERKNNTKMTYEKLSRAMRTYYEKQILVPVPKTGLYPKKLVYYYNTKILLPVSGRRLVYKFGPSARGWSSNEPILFSNCSANVYSSDEEEMAVGETLSAYTSFDVEYPIKYRELPV
ncbi:unnamed protein product [Strongylus vulgaris]|uniref:ETS domain-containing protein n=1 Tax=Strongylus vulgaris TaxID=40348 RepID=A0A3P7J9R9_STRVU|nr:unnamed protein product [Strongylus vulgaris]